MLKEDAPLIIAQTGPLKGQLWTLSKSYTIGRDSSCDIVIPDRMVSRYHARLTPTKDGIQLEDLRSKNGTHRNGNLVAGSVELEDGDVFQIALCQQFIFLASDATMPLTESNPGTSRLRMDIRSRRVWVNDIPVNPPLSALQFHVLQNLYEHQGQVMSRDQLVSASWGDKESIGVTDQALDALLRRLRDRIAAIDPTRCYIVTVRGHGVRLENPTE